MILKTLGTRINMKYIPYDALKSTFTFNWGHWCRIVIGCSKSAKSLLVQNISTVIAGLLIAFIANSQLSHNYGIDSFALHTFAQMKFLKGFTADAKVMYEEASQIATDAVSSIETVASFCSEQRVMDRYKKKCEAPRRHGI
ncbi:hypothetical protein EJ110_NYTH58615 [Nymphaea thermarum]|nr:hypothetical protein EJ110_NYTH58615 [Nymphaea thermarum]